MAPVRQNCQQKLKYKKRRQEISLNEPKSASKDKPQANWNW